MALGRCRLSGMAHQRWSRMHVDFWLYNWSSPLTENEIISSLQEDKSYQLLLDDILQMQCTPMVSVFY